MAVQNRDALWATGHDETVEVNQRALIDKVLARYSGEFTVFRELLQNADDAAAQSVEIRFETKDYLEATSSKGAEASRVGPLSLPDLKHTLTHQWTFRNDGIPFRDEDWNRLKKIAEGNPDEEKIGAFGVGFYSLFSVTEEPFVKSGSQWMGFYWKDKKDQLFARRGELPSATEVSSASGNQWTSFEMALRDPSPLPGRPVDIARFLATSLTFMAKLRDVSLYFNEHRLVHLIKQVGVPKTLEIPRMLRPASATRIMEVQGIDSIGLRIKADVLRWVYQTGTERTQSVVKTVPKASQSFFQSLFSFANPTPARTPELPPLPSQTDEDLLFSLESSVSLAVYSADVSVKLDKKMAVELERATKKKPPSHCAFQLIYTGKDEYDADQKDDEREFKSTGSVFQGLRADLDGHGSAHVFIGHSTAQTTGIGGHVAARFIPTVERESIDLVDRNVSQWNKELLYVGGFLARAIYEIELESIDTLWSGAIGSSTEADGLSEDTKSTRLWLQNKCLHALRFFTFHPSTPSSVVSDLMETAFFQSSSDYSISIISTVGVRNSRQVRSFNPTFQGFLKTLPMLPSEIAAEATAIVASLREKGLIIDVSFADVLEELRSRPLSETEMIECLKWRIGLNTDDARSHGKELREQFLAAAVFSTPAEDGGERVISLSTVQTYVNPRSSVIPVDCPLPSHTLPFSVSKHLSADSLGSLFGWKELSVVDWVSYLASPAGQTVLPPDHNLTISPVFAERVLGILARAWPSSSKDQLSQLATLLGGSTCIPTNLGMRKPKEAYLPSVNLFPDLPIVTLPKGTAVKGSLEKVLLGLGLRKHVDLQLIFSRMITTGDWSIVDLLKYLVSVKDTLSSLEWERLEKTAAFPKEGVISASTNAPGLDRPTTRYVASNLYEPADALRELGLPILDWGQAKWKGGSEEAKFLYRLGLRRFPPLEEILGLASSTTSELREAALKYFLENFTLRYAPSYDTSKFSTLAFVPAVNANGVTFLARPKEVYTDPEAAVMGFPVVIESIRGDATIKLKLSPHPPSSRIMAILLREPPTQHSTAIRYFEYLANRISDFSQVELNQLKDSPIIPTQSPPPVSGHNSTTTQLAKPSECYFGQSGTQFHSQLFTFIDFGIKANNFLRACGVKNEPTIQEIAHHLAQNPRRFYQLAGSPDSYLAELRNIAANFALIKAGTQSDLKKVGCLLGTRRISRTIVDVDPATSGEADEEEEMMYELLRPDQIVIVDDPNTFTLFEKSLWGAPQDDILESFYAKLGSRRLSTLVREDHKPLSEIMNHKLAADIHRLVLERFPILMHDPRYQARCLIKPDWLSKDGNFKVLVYSKIQLTSTLDFGGKKVVKVQEAFASARREGPKGSIALLLTMSDKVDHYEVAHSLCKLVLQQDKPNDSLLFSTILSTDLHALRRRGYNVDRIMNQQKLEKQLREARQKDAMRKAKTEIKPMPGADPFQRNPQGDAPTTGLITPALSEQGQQPNVAPTITRDEKPSLSRPSSPSLSELSSSRGNKPFGGVLSTWKQKLQRLPLPSNPSDFTMRSTPTEAGLQHQTLNGGDPFTRMKPQSSEQQTHVTSPRDIEHNIEMAIAACKEEKGSAFESRQQKTLVKESLNEGYCDVSGADGAFQQIGQVNKYNIWVSKELGDNLGIIAQKSQQLDRFSTQIVEPLRQIFGLPVPSISIFFDEKGPLIGFNRNASIFLNLRYYEAWHDRMVEKGDTSKALISWYFVLAHELAHNLVEVHSSEHEFYMSSICEKFLLDFTRILNPSFRIM